MQGAANLEVSSAIRRCETEPAVDRYLDKQTQTLDGSDELVRRTSKKQLRQAKRGRYSFRSLRRTGDRDMSACGRIERAEKESYPSFRHRTTPHDASGAIGIEALPQSL